MNAMYLLIKLDPWDSLPCAIASTPWAMVYVYFQVDELNFKLLRALKNVKQSVYVCPVQFNWKICFFGVFFRR